MFYSNKSQIKFFDGTTQLEFTFHLIILNLNGKILLFKIAYYINGIETIKKQR